MSNEDIVIDILKQHPPLYADNYNEVKKAIIKALDLVDRGDPRVAAKSAEPLEDGLMEVFLSAVEMKGRKK